MRTHQESTAGLLWTGHSGDIRDSEQTLDKVCNLTASRKNPSNLRCVLVIQISFDSNSFWQHALFRVLLESRTHREYSNRRSPASSQSSKIATVANICSRRYTQEHWNPSERYAGDGCQMS